jgi:acetyl esterase
MTRPSGSDVTAATEPDEELVALLEEMGSVPMPAFETLSPDGARQFNQEAFPTPDDPVPVGEVMNLEVGDEGVPVRVYVPEGEGPYPTLVYFHGGGWVLGTLDLYEAPCRAIVDRVGCAVVSVDYRRAPEHEFPTPLEDCYAAAEWVFESAETMHVDPDRVAVGGDSAGGNLAAAVAQLARDRDGPDVARQVLVYPVTDHAFDTPSYEENAEGYLLERSAMEWFWNHYLPSDVHGQSPYASPLRARDLSDLPPATVVTCGFDPLRDEGAAYADRLADAGVDVNHVHYEDAIHGIIQMLVEPMAVSRAHDLVDDVAADLRTTFE